MSSVVVIGAQWGDEGKGKIVDYLAQKADAVVRYSGGSNAGHTVVVNDVSYKLRLLPSGVLYSDKTNVLGNGVVINPGVVLHEIADMKAKGISCDNLVISDRAHVVLPYHARLDELQEAALGCNKIGTTKGGIGPCYMDKVARTGIRICDLMEPDTFAEKLPATILLTVSSVLLTMLIAIPLGIISAVKHNKWSDYLIRFLSFIGNSMPNFFAALVLMYFFSIKLGWLPVITTDNVALSLVLPTLTLAISMASKYTRQVRATILEELNKDYVIGARARGVRGSVIIWKNVMKSSMLTIITLLALSIGNLLGGTTIVETIFMWDGVGKMAVDAISMRDYPIIQAYVMWMAIIYVVVNLITDIIYHYLDPRVRLGGDRA